MKKILALALLLLIIGSGAFALDIAVGGGALFNYTWTMGTVKDVWTGSTGLFPGISVEQEISRLGFGAFGFVGLGRFFELNLGFLYKNPGKMKMTAKYSGTVFFEDEADISGFESVPALQFGVYFKYPFVISDMMVVFPTAGIDYEMTLADVKDGWWDDLWLRAGVGLDLFFSERAFVRIHAIYGFGIVMADEKNSVYGKDFAQAVYEVKDWDSRYSHGLLLKAGIGYMF